MVYLHIALWCAVHTALNGKRRVLFNSSLNWQVYIASVVGEWNMNMERQWDDTDRGNRNRKRKTCPGATLFTKNPTWSDFVSNLRLRRDRPANEHVWYVNGMASARVNRITWKRKAPSASFSTSNPQNLGFRAERPANNGLSQGVH